MRRPRVTDFTGIGVLRPCNARPCGQRHRSNFQRRIDPITIPSSKRTVAKAIAVPASLQARAVPRRRWSRPYPAGRDSTDKGRWSRPKQPSTRQHDGTQAVQDARACLPVQKVLLLWFCLLSKTLTMPSSSVPCGLIFSPVNSKPAD